MMLNVVKYLNSDDLRHLVTFIQSGAGVDYSAKHGGVCPVCGAAKSRVTNTSKWSGSVRERFHRCRSCGLRFKSVETE